MAYEKNIIVNKINDTEGLILALYDFGSKQEYIYRTPKIKEISGASTLMAGLYKKFIAELNTKGITCSNNTDTPFKLEEFKNSSLKGTVVYDGGGNLMMIYRTYNDFIDANKIISEYLVNNAPTLRLIPAYTVFTGDFAKDKSNLYKCNATVKNGSPFVDVPLVTPMTQIDPMTFRPVTEKGCNELYPGEYSLSADRVAKVKAFNGKARNNELRKIDDLEDNLIAVIFIDGNSMGNKIKKIENADYNTGIKYLRAFSSKVKKAYVDDTTKAIKEIFEDTTTLLPMREVISNGDEITIICKAKDALRVVKTYFMSLANSDNVFPDEIAETLEGDSLLKNTSCAGICIAHAKTPFNLIYQLADEACESAKAVSHLNGNDNRFDFYYCHAGVTTDFDTLREREQSMTGRPYEVYGDLFGKSDAEIGNFDRLTPVLQAMGRSNVKALGTAIQLGDENFRFETERVNAYLSDYNKKHNTDYSITEADKALIYDMAEFYDLWFTSDEDKNAENEGGEEE